MDQATAAIIAREEQPAPADSCAPACVPRAWTPFLSTATAALVSAEHTAGCECAFQPRSAGPESAPSELLTPAPCLHRTALRHTGEAAHRSGAVAGTAASSRDALSA